MVVCNHETTDGEGEGEATGREAGHRSTHVPGQPKLQGAVLRPAPEESLVNCSHRTSPAPPALERNRQAVRSLRATAHFLKAVETSPPVWCCGPLGRQRCHSRAAWACAGLEAVSMADGLGRAGSGYLPRLLRFACWVTSDEGQATRPFAIEDGLGKNGGGAVGTCKSMEVNIPYPDHLHYV